MALASRKGIGGPKTAEGKRKVSVNAITHGRNVESPQGLEAVQQMVGATYLDVVEEMTVYYRPTDPIEATLVRRIARCAWRIMVSEKMEDAILERRGWIPSVGVGRDKLIRNERLIDVQLHRAIDMLCKKRAYMQKTTQNKLPQGLFPSVGHAQPGREFVLPQTGS